MDSEVVWAKAAHHRRLIKRLQHEVIVPARTERDAAIDRAMAKRDVAIAKADRLYKQQRASVVASLRKNLLDTKRSYGEKITELGESTWDRLASHAQVIVGSPHELKPWHNLELTVPVCQMIIWMERDRERAAMIADEHRRDHAAVIRQSNRMFEEELCLVYERWHGERANARAIHRWGRDRRQAICKEFSETGDAATAIAKLSEMIAYDQWLPSPQLNAREYLRKKKGIDPWPSIQVTVRKLSD